MVYNGCMPVVGYIYALLSIQLFIQRTTRRCIIMKTEYFDDFKEDFIVGQIEEERLKGEDLYQKPSSGVVEVDKKEKEARGNVNQDIRAINDYFLEVSRESLLTPREESVLSAKITVCQKKLAAVKKEIEKITGYKVKIGDGKRRMEQVDNIIPFIQENNILPQDVFEKVRKLVSLFICYQNELINLKGRFVKSNLRLVAKIAKRFSGRGVPFLDLVQEGNLGLMRAVEKFDHKKGYRFSTYACWWITQSMIRGLFSQTRTVKIPAYILEQAKKIKGIRSKLYKKTGSEPLPKEIAKIGNMSENSVRYALNADKSTHSLDSPVWDGENTTFLDFIADDESFIADEIIAKKSLPMNVDRALLELAEREREVIKMRFGIGYKDSFTLDEIGKKFQLTRERIRQIEKRALTRLRRSRYGRSLYSFVRS